jgi:hypothetical protein
VFLMTFQLPAMTALVVIVSVAAALALSLVLGTAVAAVVTHRRVRLARHEGLRTYYGPRLLAH